MTTPTTCTIERGSFWDLFHDGLCSIENLCWEPVRSVEMTIDNRGAAVALRRKQRLVWGEKVWYGLDYSYVELRVWHDGSITVEQEEVRGG